MSEIIVKLTDDQVVNILLQIDEILKTNKLKIASLFKDDIFDLSDIKNVDYDFLYGYFTGYTTGEFMKWVKKNISYYNDFISKDNKNRPDKIAKCYMADIPIVASADYLIKMLKKRKSRGAYIGVTFYRNIENVCDKLTYENLRSNFTNNRYYTDTFNILSETPEKFTLHIEMNEDSIKMEIEGLENLQIYLASSSGWSDIYYEDTDVNWPDNYAAKVMKYHDEDYIWIYKSSLQSNYDEVQSMLECVMFACHFPIDILRHSVVPMYSIKSIQLSETIKVNGVYTVVDRNIKIPDELLFVLPNNEQTNGNNIPFPKYDQTQQYQINKPQLMPTKYDQTQQYQINKPQLMPTKYDQSQQYQINNPQLIPTKYNEYNQ